MKATNVVRAVPRQPPDPIEPAPPRTNPSRPSPARENLVALLAACVVEDERGDRLHAAVTNASNELDAARQVLSEIHLEDRSRLEAWASTGKGEQPKPNEVERRAAEIRVAQSIENFNLATTARADHDVTMRPIIAAAQRARIDVHGAVIGVVLETITPLLERFLWLAQEAGRLRKILEAARFHGMASGHTSGVNAGYNLATHLSAAIDDILKAAELIPGKRANQSDPAVLEAYAAWREFAGALPADPQASSPKFTTEN